MTLSFWARLLPLASLAFVAQGALFDQVVVLGVHPDLLVVLAAAAGIVLGPGRGSVAGFVVGLLADMLVVLPYGLSPLTFSLLAFAVGVLPSLGSLDRRPGLDLTVCVVAAPAGTLLYAALATLVGQHAMFGPSLVDAMLVVTVAAALLGLPAVWSMRWAARGLAVPPAAIVPPGGSALG